MKSESELARSVEAIPILRAWDIPGLRHGFIGRLGGVSQGPFATMNLSYWVGDDDGAVDANWERLRRSAPIPPAVARLNQVHGSEVHAVTQAGIGIRPPGDGMVTAERGIALGIFTADCVPILLVDAKNRIAGALHAGWRGVLADIAAAGVRAMVTLGADPSEIRAALGPSIGPCCFEVDEALADRFVKEIPGAERHRRAGRPGKAYLNLRGIVRDRFEQAGIAPENIAEVGPCTRCASDRFFSRRAAEGASTGLQMSYIGFDDRPR
ncbi:MAG: peptidoglycan editing factor PgeF [Candidatus Binataceae bacterium]